MCIGGRKGLKIQILNSDFSTPLSWHPKHPYAGAGPAYMQKTGHEKYQFEEVFTATGQIQICLENVIVIGVTGNRTSFRRYTLSDPVKCSLDSCCTVIYKNYKTQTFPY